MKTGNGLLTQLERCGLSAKLADEYREASEDSSGFRLVKIEIARAWAALDQPTLPEAEAAQRWLASQPGELVSVGQDVDLVDQATGEVLVSGRPGAVLASPHMVVMWKNADAFDDSEPEEDLGSLAMGLATCNGQPFRVATLAIRGMETFPRRSEEITPDKHPALLARIKAAVGRPRIACPGDWCGACKQAPYCEAWLARAKTSLAVFTDETQIATVDEPKDMKIPQLDLTDDTAGLFAARLEIIEKALKLAKEQLKSFVRKGGKCVKNRKEYCSGSRDGKKTVNASELEAFIETLNPE